MGLANPEKRKQVSKFISCHSVPNLPGETHFQNKT